MKWSMESQRYRTANPVLWADSSSPYSDKPNNEAKACKSSGAPKPGRILLSNGVPFLDINSFSSRSRDSQGNAGANLECSVQLQVC